MSQPAVGLIGVGHIGWYLTDKLRRAGFPLTVFDVDEERVELAVEEKGASGAESAAGVVENSDVILLSLPGRPYVESAMEAEDGVLQALNGGEVVVDTSTTPPDLDVHYATECERRGAGYVDAPLTWGGPGEYDDETGPAFSVFVGGDDADYERARPVIECFAHQHEHFGPPGTGHVVKAAHRMRQNCTAAVDWEFTELLRNNDVDPELVDDLLEIGIKEELFENEFASVAGFDAAVAGEDAERPRGFEVSESDSGVRLHRSEWAKDPGYALDIAHASNTYTPILSTVYQTQLAAENLASALFQREIDYGDEEWYDRTDTATVYRRLNRPAEEWRTLAEQSDRLGADE